ncbi:MAG: hypothetical protein A3F54_04800 [Candidatus Kerfeldbacteria bacterium RIFCSPHIGHO2_12_FULL_48_17]|uniref:RNA polymerase sigma-70 domain-containing protein n=1 Tax=Candidatus Kerfeldbacteria bacterium RIFCSPHIGHO2_12_FULL_48_17 TaxID=1798542 RepID=A0A1G2B0Y6_9BACT|nr:MAG: hypothetical protein A3F54_04800 [Candidatus Kerfeldbacteria bacterium RIFCSPHIGHO2_12_FULL_48_17]
MSDSILDKIITSQQVSEIQSFQATEILNQLLSKLSQKEEDILRRRFGLHEREPETLENIGKHYNVTRERIRQIESLGVKRMKEKPDFRSKIASVEHVLTTVFQKSGGFLTEEKLFEKLLGEYKEAYESQRAILFILSHLLSEKFHKHAANEKTRHAWKVLSASQSFLEEALEHLHNLIDTHGKPLKFEDVHEKFSQHEFYQKHQDKLSEDVLSSFLDISQKIDKNPFDEYGLTHWGAISPKRMDDKIYLILKKESRPLHFTDIAERISKTFKKRAYPPTVHNELILNAEYILVGRGIYALKEWGYTSGVVADVLENILKREQRPMTREELVKAVLKERIVKRNTIHLALTNKKKFKKNSDNAYELNAETPQTPAADMAK